MSKTPTELLASTKPSGQEPNAKAAFMRLDPQSESAVLDRLCYEFELVRAETKSLTDLIAVVKAAMTRPAVKPTGNGHSEGGTPLTEVFLKEALNELLSYIHGYSLASNRSINFHDAIEEAKPILRTAMRALHSLNNQPAPLPPQPVRLAAPPAVVTEEQSFVEWRATHFAKILIEEVEESLWDAPNAIPIMRQAIRLGAFLMSKNKAYGDSALKPLRVFSKADPAEQIRVRLDDKLSRLARGQLAGEDALLDLVGYYILLKVAEEEASHGG